MTTLSPSPSPPSSYAYGTSVTASIASKWATPTSDTTGSVRSRTGQVKHLQKALLRNDTKYYTVIKLDDPSKLPAVDESKGIYAAGKLMEDTKKIIHRGSRPTEKKEDLDALDKQLYWVVTKHTAVPRQQRSRSTECPSTSPRRTKSEGSPTPSASGWPSQRTSRS